MRFGSLDLQLGQVDFSELVKALEFALLPPECAHLDFEVKDAIGVVDVGQDVAVPGWGDVYATK